MKTFKNTLSALVLIGLFNFSIAQNNATIQPYKTLENSSNAILSDGEGISEHVFSFEPNQSVVSKPPMVSLMTNKKTRLNLNLNLKNDMNSETPFFRNRRNVYSSLWAFASLNYLYADLVGLMDANVLAQYQTGVVNGVSITPNFLTVAAGFMQIPIANVFLPHLIKNEKTLKWVQIASGTIMTLVQTGTLFVDKPAPYYALFSAFEIAATTYITIDAIKWKPGQKQHAKPIR